MKSRHIAIFTILSAGHVYPALGLCSELVSRGYRVTYPTSERFADKIRQTGAEPVVFNLPELKNAEKIRRYPSSHDPRFWRLFATIFCPAFLTSAAGTLAEVEGFYRENAPDLVLYEWFAFAGRILAKRQNIPAAQLWAHFAHQGHLIREEGVCHNPKPMLGFAHLVDSFMSAHGIDETDSLWHTEKLNIYFVPREFQFNGDSFDERSCFVGPCLNRPPRGSWHNNSRGKPILLISESAATPDARFLKICIDAFAGSGYHVVFSVGGSSAPSSTTPLPENFEINRDAYNIEIFPHAALTICQGGMGTTLESLYFGVPVLAVPVMPYHTEVAYRLAELGLGTHLPERDVSVAAMIENVGRILADKSLLKRVKAMQQALRNSGGAAMAANHIERFLDG